MKKLSKRWISLFLSLLMFCTSIPVYAEDVQTAMVVFEPMEHGTITVDGEDVTGQEREVSIGDTVSYQVTAEDGYVVDYVTTAYEDGSSKQETVGYQEYSNTVVVSQDMDITAVITEVETQTEEKPAVSEGSTEGSSGEVSGEVSKETEESSGEVSKETEESSESSSESGTGKLWAYIDPDTSDINMLSLDNDGPYQIQDERYDIFGGDLRMGIKYIVGDNENKDSHGVAGHEMWRYVYCLEYHKDAPDGKGTFSYARDWTNRKVAYAYYWGAVYYYQTCRWPAYSTNNWQLDYFVTQWAIHILNGERSLSSVTSAINRSSAPSWARTAAVQKITAIVNDANNAANYSNFTSDGWISMADSVFTLNGDSTGWKDGGDGYMYSNGTYSCSFSTHGGYDFREQISGYSISAPGAEVHKLDNRTYTDFDIRIPKSMYASYQATGKTITITVTASIPTLWGIAIYNPPASNYQKVGMLNWSGSGGTTTRTQTKTIKIPQAGGKIQINKRSADTSKTNGNSEYSLQGAVFDIYSGNSIVDIVTTDGNGNATSKTLNFGSYTIKERTASKGYNKAGDISVNHRSGTTSVTINEPVKTGTITVQKKAEDNTYSGYGSYSLKGAEYTVYNASGKSVGMITTDANGKGSLGGLALGKYTVKETKAPAGYYLSTDTTTVSFNTNTTTATVNSTEKVATFSALDLLLLEKKDAETDSASAQGAGSLTGAEYTVKYYDVISDHDPSKDAKDPKYTWVFKTDSKGQIKVDADHLVSGTLPTDGNGNIIFPIGTLTIQESKAPEGYNLSDTVFVANTYVKNNTTEIKNLPTGSRSAKDVIVRGDIQFSKTNEKNAAMAGIPFKLTSKTTGESHIIYSNKDGMIRTAVRNNDNPNTGTNGVWFGAGKASSSKGALPYDTYLVEEQPCEKNQGYILDSFEVTISKEGSVVKADTVKNLPTLKSIAVTKRIKASDINFANGNPIFTFKCTGTDYDGAKHTYYQMVEVKKGDVTDEEYVSVSCTFKDLKMGDYVVTEEQASRYAFEKLTAENGTVSGEKVSFHMIPANNTYTATFTNKKFEWQYFTDSTMKTNTITVKK